MEKLKQLIRTIPDFPKEGIMFRDITPLLLNPRALQDTMKYFEIRYKGRKIDKIAGIESRGFIFGSMLALALNIGFIPIRKPGKLPAEVERVDYSLEYGTDALEMHKDAINPGENILLVDDLLATGGTARAAIQLIESAGGNVVELAFLIELLELNGSEKIEGYNKFCMIEY